MITLSFPTYGLKTRITVGVLAIFVAGLWSLSFYVSRMLREDMQRLLGEQQASTVSYIAAEINGALGERFRGLENAAASISPAMLDHPAALQKFLEDRSVLQWMFSAGLMVTGGDGTTLADVPLSAGRLGVNYGSTDSVAAALKEGKATIGRPVIGKKLRVPLFAMTVPIRDTRGKVIGSVMGMTDLSQPNFLDRITENHYGKTGGYLLVAPQYRLIVTATEKSRIMEAHPEPGVNPWIDRRNEGYEGTEIFVNPRGVEVLNSAKGIPVAGWQVIALLPTEEAFAPIRDLQRRMLLATIFLTLLAGGLTLWLLRRQFLPMLTAVRVLATLPDTSQPAQPPLMVHQDETDQLIGGFNRLLEAVAHREEALKESEAELLRSNRELEQFSFGLSHDMRQPLRMITSYLQLIQQRMGDQLVGEKRDYFHFAIDGAKRMEAMMLGLLEYSRVGRKGEPAVWVESRAVLDEALLFLRPAIAEAKAVVRIEGDWPHVFVSRDEISRLLQNLIGNALKFRVAGRTPEITIASEMVDQEWRVSVVDNGAGIRDSQIDRLFQVFQRLHSRNAYEGTGIGLALCRKIVERHGGRIWAESAGENQGCSFRFTVLAAGEIPALPKESRHE
jgi:signal transduction histidine kinase